MPSKEGENQYLIETLFDETRPCSCQHHRGASGRKRKCRARPTFVATTAGPAELRQEQQYCRACWQNCPVPGTAAVHPAEAAHTARIRANNRRTDNPAQRLAYT